eukprot:g13101.t1
MPRTTLVKRPADLTDLGYRFLAVLLMKSGLGFNPVKTAHALNQGAFGLVIVIERKTARAQVIRKKALEELESGLKFQAKLDVEQLVRQELEIKAYDTLRLRCNELSDRLGAVSSERECPDGLKEAVCTIIWAAGKAEVPEKLAVVKAQLTRKYGNKLVLKAEGNEGGCVDRRVSAKLLFQTDPPPQLVEDHLATMTKEIEAQQQLSASPSSPYSFYSRIKRRLPTSAAASDPTTPPSLVYSTPSKPRRGAAVSPALSTPPPSSSSSSSSSTTARSSLDDKQGFERYRLFIP